MKNPHRNTIAVLTLLALTLPGRADEGEWIDLNTLDTFRSPTGDWTVAADAALHPDNPKLLKAMPGEGILINGETGRTRDLYTTQKFRDVELHLEFIIPKGSNSGVKFMGLYEIQILDSAGRDKLTGDSCGGIYPRAQLQPRYTYLDDGVPPRVNSAKPAGEWQTLDVTFRAPRFDEDGNKIENARIVKATLNGEVIHEDVEMKTPTGHNWVRDEVAEGPLMIQADHGPVAIRNSRVRPIEE